MYDSDKAQADRESFEDLMDVIYAVVEEDWLADHLYDDMEIDEIDRV